MKRLKRIKLTTVLISLASAWILSLLIIGALSYYDLGKVNGNVEAVYSDRLVPITEISSIKTSFLNMRIYTNKAMLKYNADYNKQIREEYTKINSEIKKYASTEEDADMKNNISELEQQLSKYLSTWESTEKTLISGKNISDEDLKNFTDTGVRIQAIFDKLLQQDVGAAEELSKQSKAIFDNSIAIFAAIFFIITFLVLATAIIVIRFIKSSSQEVIDVLSQVAEGDFSYRNTEVSDNEFGRMKASLAKTTEKVSVMIQVVKDKALSIDMQTDNLTAVAEEMSSSSENVSSAIQDVALGTGGQAQDLVNITSVLHQFGEEIEKIASEIHEMETNSKSIGTMASDSSKKLQLVMDSVAKIRESFNDFIKKTSNLGQSINQINDITVFINSIADQTNLLALNAAIEAARAGEAGRGFSVVAEEIRKLAEQSKTSSEKINMLVKGISSETDVMISSTGSMSEELDYQISTINVSSEAFKGIISSINEILPKIEVVNAAANSINAEKNTILQKIENASSIAEEVSASSEEIAAASEEMSASSQEVASTSLNLSSMTKDVMNEVNKFKL